MDNEVSCCHEVHGVMGFHRVLWRFHEVENTGGQSFLRTPTLDIRQLSPNNSGVRVVQLGLLGLQ